ncbi:MAG: hypothetical protein WBI06_12605 [Paludibacter sp.]
MLPKSELRHPAFAAGKTRSFLCIIPTQFKRTAAVELRDDGIPIPSGNANFANKG